MVIDFGGKPHLPLNLPLKQNNQNLVILQYNNDLIVILGQYEEVF